MDSFTATLPAGRYKVMDAPDPLYNAEGERCVALADDGDRVIWFDPEAGHSQRMEALATVLCSLWREQMDQIPSLIPFVS